MLYFAADPEPLEGFLRGLSVVSNQPMPSSKSLVHLPQPMTDEYGGDVSVPQIQVRSVTLFNMLLKYPSTSTKKARSQVLVLLVPPLLFGGRVGNYPGTELVL